MRFSSIKSVGTAMVLSVAALGFAQAALAQDEARQAAPAGTVRAVDSPLWKELGYDKANFGPLANQVVSVLSEEGLKALSSGADPADVMTLSGRTVKQEIQALGSFADEMVFTPVAPCRLIDTRQPGAGGVFAVNETRNYNLIGPNDYSGIGGNAAGCNIPTTFGGGIISLNTVRALVVNIVAVAAQGPGDFRAYPTNLPVPTASIINYAGGVPGLNLANGVLLQSCNAICIDFVPPFTCGDPCPTGDLSFLAEGSAVQLVVDVLGYFTAATISGVQGASSEGINNTANTAVTTACANLTSCTVTNNSSGTVGVLVTGTVNAEITHAAASLDVMVATLSNVNGTTCGTDEPDAGTGIFEIPASYPAASLIDGTITVTKRFTLASGTSQEYFLNARMAFGDGGDQMDSANVVCHIDR